MIGKLLFLCFFELLILSIPHFCLGDTIPQVVRYGEPCPTGKEMNIWLIGDKHGIDWSNGTPNIISGLKADIYEGHTSYCRPDGSLAIYTEGHHVYNGQGTSIRFTAAEFVSNNSSTMSLILAKPGQDSLYYVFHMDAALKSFNDPEKLYYSVYNIKTESMVQRVGLLDTTSEKITAIRHCNGKDWWVIGMKGTGDSFFAWLLSDSGLASTPVVSKSGFEHLMNSLSYPFYVNAGYLKPSHDGSLLTEITIGDLNQPDFLEVHSFDPATGKIRFLTQLTVDLLSVGLYACEYSPDNQYLYVTTNTLWQFELSVIDSAAMMNSLKIFDFSSLNLGDLGSPVLGPDGRMYMTSFWKNYLHLIPEPNKAYPDCGFIPRYINVGSQTGLAAPQYPSGLMWPYRAYMRGPYAVCRSDTSHWYLTDPCPHEKIVWSLPDGGNVLENGDTLKAYFDQEGVYQIIASYLIPCGYKSDTMRIQVSRCHCPSDFQWLQIDSLVCRGESASLLYNSGSWLPASGIKDSLFVLSSVFSDTTITMKFYGPENCDTLIRVPIKIIPDKQTSQNISLCQNDSARVNGVWYQTDTILEFKNLAYTGCDSIHLISIKVNPQTHGRKLWPVCPGDSILLFGKTFYYDTILINQYTDRFGCDSLHIDEIKVGGTDSILLNHIICRGDSLTIEGQVYSNNTYLEKRLISSRGCEDSLVIHDIKLVEPSALISEQIRLCFGDSVRIGGRWYRNDTIIRLSYLNSVGCDSTHEWKINVIPAIPIRKDTIYFCIGDSVLIERHYYYNSIDLDLHYTSHRACDSNVILSLIQYPENPFSESSHFVCYGDSILINGNYYSKDTIFWNSYSDQNGCDSNSISNIIVIPGIPTTEILHSICPGDSVIIDGKIYKDSAIITRHYSSQLNSCDSIVNHKIGLLPAPEIVQIEIFSCPGDTVQVLGKTYVTDASFEIKKPSPSGCDSLISYNIQFYFAQEAGLPDFIELDKGDSLRLTPWIGPNIKSIRWYPPDGLSCSNCADPIVLATKESLLYLEVMDDAGCIQLDSVFIYLRKKEPEIYIPNAFSPNGDGVNDFWLPTASHPSVRFNQIQIYDRWGGLIFSWLSSSQNELAQGWDGKFKGRVMMPGVYVYRIKYSTQSKSFEEINGALTLIR